MKKLIKRISIFAFALFVLSAAACVSGGISEDPVYEAYPPLDPEDGIEREVSTDLYFRLTGEPYLVKVTRNISVRANESRENAVLRALLEGPPPLSDGVSAVFPSYARVVSVHPDGGILYVTMSREFMETNKNAASRKEMDEDLRLSVYALVNSLSALGSTNRIQILIDLDNSGTGSRVQRAMLGLHSENQAASQLLEPLGFNEDIVTDAGKVADLALRHLNNGEYEQAYLLFSQMESGGFERPSYASFETELKSLGTLTDYSIISFGPAEGSADFTATADIKFTYSDGSVKTVQGAALDLYREGDLIKVGYNSLLRLFER
jgi:hypothetical protein